MHIRKWIALTLLLVSTGFSLWLYRAEPTTTIDPNDNAFQYALIDRTNTIWDYAKTVCPKTITYPVCHISYLLDHWVPNWAEGYNLPYYYSHIPQITIVGSYRLLLSTHLLSPSITLFQYYHSIIYLLLCSIPLVLFLAFRILSLPWLLAGSAAVYALLISTDGLYGVDQTSFLWRGWGLSSQLFALLFFPLAIASAIRFTSQEHKKTVYFVLTALCLTATTAGHLGIGMMAWMAIAVICFTPVVVQILDKGKPKAIQRQLVTSIKTTCILLLPTCVLLGYWIIPVFTGSAYHNTSVWDPVWKFNSFGVVDVITKLVSGTLFDFGRVPLLTLFIFVGLFVSYTVQKEETKKYLQPLGMLFLFFLVLLFGRTTFGGLIDLIPGMSEFHGHRFIVGLHIAGLFLAPLGAMWLTETIETIGNKLLNPTIQKEHIAIGSYMLVLVLSCIFLLPLIVSYAKQNEVLIGEANTNHKQAKADMDTLFNTIKTLQTTIPGRVYALRGTEGNTFRIASTPYYMQLSTYGINTVLWLPETWSPNSDTEQFFNEDNPEHYNLYNITSVVTTPEKLPQSFWNTRLQTPHWILYDVDTNGYIDGGYAPSVAGSTKQNYINLVHLWLQSPYPASALYPELRITDKTINTSLPHFQMIDQVTYKTPDNILHNIFAEPPVYEQQKTKLPVILSQSQSADMRFTATVRVTDPCQNCIILLKQTYHPNWTATVNGKHVLPIEVFPSYVAIRLEEPGDYDITFTYQPSTTKMLLFVGGILSTLLVGIVVFRKKHHRE